MNKFRMLGQAAILFIVCPIGLLGAYAFTFESGESQNVSLGLFMGAVAIAGLALAAWRVSMALRTKD